ncbi:DUF4278 domain-containing protein [Synechococcus sp. PCC 7336]|uniref:DUF4278 domain-containing protein n=1 Tax=Synechococcus sp. PCC 7336 TaxID=195250 RepID=UPI00034B3971|nr:DUF4278 domain-containing protein [Synechococcus sp. PCC 7336]
MNLQFLGSRFDYAPPTAESTNEVLNGQFHGREFAIRKQVKRNPLQAAKYTMKYRGH